jgi:hypothetical protein
MGTSRELTERQLELARQRLSDYTNRLKSEGVAEKSFSRDPAYRALRSKVKQVAARIERLGEVEALDAELNAQRPNRLAERAERRAARAAARKAAKAEAVEKAKAAAAKPAAKAGKGASAGGAAAAKKPAAGKKDAGKKDAGKKEAGKK